MARILSLDIAFENLGWVCFEKNRPTSCDVIHPFLPNDSKKTMSVREKNVLLMDSIIRQLNKVINDTQPNHIVGEAPTGGSKSVVAAKKMNMALALVTAICVMQEKPPIYCTPGDVKKIIGKKPAPGQKGQVEVSKDEIMDWAIDRYGGEKDIKTVQIKKGKRAGQSSNFVTYHFLDGTYPKTTFEHIADACAAYEAILKKHKELSQYERVSRTSERFDNPRI